MKLVRDTDVCGRANRTAAAIRDGMNDVIRRRGVAWCVYGEFSAFHLFPRAATAEDVYGGRIPWAQLKGTTPLALQQEIRTGFLCEGVDLVGWPGGLVSAVHTGEDVDRTVGAFERVVGQASGLSRS